VVLKVKIFEATTKPDLETAMNTWLATLPPVRSVRDVIHVSYAAAKDLYGCLVLYEG
jgi:hypothetical protein